MNSIWEFISLSDPNVRYVVLGSILIGASAGLVGTFTFLNKKSLLGDAIAHATLPGVCLSFMLTYEKNIYLLLIGAFLSGWIATYAVSLITSRSKIKNDTAIAIVLSSFFGLGIVLITHIQQSGNAAQSGLNSFLVGKAAAMGYNDVVLFLVLGLLIIVFIILFYKPLQLVVFNKEYADSIGIPTRFIEFLLSSLTVLTIAIGIQAVGVILMAALLITPAAAARFWTHRLTIMLLLSGIIGSFAGVFGAYVSFQAPNMPTGPWIVSFLSVIAIGSAFFAPKSGVLYRLQMQNKNRKKIQIENVLKTIFQWHEANGYSTQVEFQKKELLEVRHFQSHNLEKNFKKIMNKSWIHKIDVNTYKLTESGWKESMRIVRLHRLWELYLNQKMNMAEDHIHANAETMEHILTPEMEKLLLKELDYPDKDPHNSAIPHE